MIKESISAVPARSRDIYQPPPGSAVSNVIELIKRRGPMRTKELSEALGKRVWANQLEHAVRHGLLVACKVTVPGSSPQTEYRIGCGVPPRVDAPLKPIPMHTPSRIAAAENAVSEGHPEIVPADPPAHGWELNAPAARSTKSLVGAKHPPKTSPAGDDDLRIALYSDGTVTIGTDEATVELTAGQVLELGDFLVLTEKFWRR